MMLIWYAIRMIISLQQLPTLFMSDKTLYRGAFENNDPWLVHSLKFDYHPTTATPSELTWIQSFLHEVGVSSSSTPSIYCETIVLPMHALILFFTPK